MELKQADIFGGYKLIVKKNNKIKPPKKQSELKPKIELLYNLYEKLYEQLNINLMEQRDLLIKNKGKIIIFVYPEDRQAEPIDLYNTGLYDLDKRIERMKEVLECYNMTS